MAYCTSDDIENKLPSEQLEQIVNDSNSDPMTDKTARITAAIVYADSIIDGYCGVKYNVPLGVTPDIIKNISVDLAIWSLVSRRWDVIDESSIFRLRYKDAMEQLKGISTGRIVLSVPEPDENADRVSETTVESDGSSRIFSQTSLTGL